MVVAEGTNTGAGDGEGREPLGAGRFVIVPTYREAENIRRVLEGIRAALPGATVVVVDDEGGDGTADLAEAVGREIGGVEVVRRHTKEGLGPAYLAGFAVARQRGASALVGMDADLSHDTAVLPRLFAALDAGADVAIGSRWVPGGSTVDWPLHRRLLSQAGNRYASVALGLGVHDATSAFRAVRAEALAAIDLDGVASHGYGFNIEIVHRLAASGAVFAEVPIVFADRTAGQSKMTPAIAVEAFVVVTRIALRQLPARVARRLRR